MDTRVVNVRVKYIRPEYENLKEWCQDPNNVYIGRKRIVYIDGQRYPSEDSVWANPYKVGRDGDREQVVDKYLDHIANLVKNGKLVREDFVKLKGKNLGCWCKPDSCHGDILVHIINHLI